MRNWHASKKICLVMASILLSSTTLFGCSDLKEINNLAIVTALGFDLTADGKIEVTTQIFLPMTQGSSTAPTNGAQSNSFSVMTATGTSITEAVNNIERRTSRQLFRSHDRAIFISKRMAKTHLRDILDYCLRFREIRERVDLFISGSPIAELLTYPPFLERNSGDLLNKIVQKDGNHPVTVLNALMMSTNPTRPNILPIVTITKSPLKEGTKQITINQSALFRNDRWVGTMTHQLSYGQLMVTGNFWQTVFTLKLPHHQGVVGLNLQNVKVNVIPKLTHGKWLALIHVVGDQVVFENTTDLNTDQLHAADLINKQTGAILTSLIHRSLRRSQLLRTDVFNFYTTFYRSYPRECLAAKKNWQQVYPSVRARVTTNLHLIHSGVKD